MAQILAPLTLNYDRRILCCYFNNTSQIQVVRIANVSNWYFERIVFLGQRLLFEALPEAHLEIYTGMSSAAILSDRISCHLLRVSEDLPSRYLTASETRLGV